MWSIVRNFIYRNWSTTSAAAAVVFIFLFLIIIISFQCLVEAIWTWNARLLQLNGEHIFASMTLLASDTIESAERWTENTDLFVCLQLAYDDFTAAERDVNIWLCPFSWCRLAVWRTRKQRMRRRNDMHRHTTQQHRLNYKIFKKWFVRFSFRKAHLNASPNWLGCLIAVARSLLRV